MINGSGSDPQENAEQDFDVTLDLAELAQVNHGDRVNIGAINNRTQELFDRTLKLANNDQTQAPIQAPPEQDANEFIPQDIDLRSRFYFAEALGGYEILNDVINVYSAGRRLCDSYGAKVATSSLKRDEVIQLEEYHNQLHEAMHHAHEYLHTQGVSSFSDQELQELNELLISARTHAENVTRILGTHYIHRVEDAVQTLHIYHKKMRSVEKSISGIFMVDKEVLFIPGDDLIDCVNAIFKGVGNPYLADNIDGMMLLAARNLLIEVVSFYSYYGKEQVYRLFTRGSAQVNPKLITIRIRHEINKLFQAFQESNKLVLTRVMRNAEREFELSVEAIQVEAEMSAVDAVVRMMPTPEPKPPAEVKKGLFKRLLSWLVN